MVNSLNFIFPLIILKNRGDIYFIDKNALHIDLKKSLFKYIKKMGIFKNKFWVVNYMPKHIPEHIPSSFGLANFDVCLLQYVPRKWNTNIFI